MLAALLLVAQGPTTLPKQTRLPKDGIRLPINAKPRVGWLPTIANYTPSQPEYAPKLAGEGVDAGLLKPNLKPTVPYATVTNSKWKSALQAQGLTVAPGPGKGWDMQKVRAAGQAGGVDYIGMVVLAGAKYGSNPHQSWIQVEGVLQVMDAKSGKFVGDPLLVSGNDNNSPHDSNEKYVATVKQAAYKLATDSVPLQMKANVLKVK